MDALAIVVVSYGTVDVLAECLTAVFAHTAGSPQVIVVDNASADGSAAMVRERFPQVALIESPRNVGFGAANNLGVRRATAPYCMLLNSDAILAGDTGHRLVEYLESHPDVACVGPRVVLPDGAGVQPRTFGDVPTMRSVFMQSTGMGRLLPQVSWCAGIDGERSADGIARDLRVGWISGVCMAMRTADFLAVGGFDPRFFMYCEDVDLCMKLSSRGAVMLVDRHDVMHYGGVSSKSVAQRVRNTVWQQRHLLTIVRERQGAWAAAACRLFVASGLVARLVVGAALIPWAGVRDNETLRSAWSRLRDAVRPGALHGA